MATFYGRPMYNRGPLYFCPVVSFFFLSIFFPRLISAAVDWMFYTWRGPSANSECRSEMRCTRLAANAGPKKVAKNRHLAPSHNFVRLYLCNWGMYRQSEKSLL